MRLRTGKRKPEAADAPAADAQPEAADAQPPPEAAPEAPAAAEAEPAPVTAMASTNGGDGDRSGGNGAGRKGLLSRMYGDVGENTAAERERVAAQEFEYWMGPPMELLQASVPEASSPQEARAEWERRQGEILPDPKGGAQIEGDAYSREARIYYRLLRRDYEANPRPAKDRQPYYLGNRGNKSHYLHDTYHRLPGVKGW